MAISFGKVRYLRYNDPSGILLDQGFIEGSLKGGCHLLTSSCFVFLHRGVRISASFILPRCKAEPANFLDLVYRDDYLIYRQECIDTRYMHTTDWHSDRKQENVLKKETVVYLVVCDTCHPTYLIRCFWYRQLGFFYKHPFVLRTVCVWTTLFFTSLLKWIY